jgi:hypothetical protein
MIGWTFSMIVGATSPINTRTRASLAISKYGFAFKIYGKHLLLSPLRTKMYGHKRTQEQDREQQQQL